MKYSIVIVSYNSGKFIKQCVESIQMFTKDYEIIIVDNYSKKDTRQELKKLAGAKVICNKENKGYSAACNQGLKEARGEYIIFLNPDTIVTQEWADRLTKYLENDKVGAVGPISNYVAGIQNWMLHLPAQIFQSSQINISEVQEMVKTFTGLQTPLLIGFCIAMRRKLISDMGGFDEELFLGNDDLDLSYRLKKEGYKLIAAINCFIFHHGQESFKTEPSEKTSKLVQESTDRLYEKLNKSVDAFREWGIEWFKPTERKPLTSIIILTKDNLKYTKECIESINKFTTQPYEIIVVDNNSSDDTPEYITSEVLNIDAVIYNKENRGFAGGNNQGIKIAKGDYICFLNNDCVVTPGWLERLQMPMSNPVVGMTGPVSNYVSGHQKVNIEGYNYKTLEELAVTSQMVAQQFNRQVEKVNRLVGFCLLVKKEVIDKIGVFDERFCNFEDDDLCLRAILAGYDLLICRDCFIHHYGSKTFESEGLNLPEILKENMEKFRQKWHIKNNRVNLWNFDYKKLYVEV